MSSPEDWLREPGAGRYARVERERRFLVAGPVPDGTAVRTIEDRYLAGTRLRLRTVSGDGRVVHKLTQKVRLLPDDPSRVSLTNTYLSDGEQRVLAALDATTLVKARSVVDIGGLAWVVDRFGGRLSGLVLAEVEAPPEPLPLPDWLGREVTLLERFSGGRLAAADDEQVQSLLAEARVGCGPSSGGR